MCIFTVNVYELLGFVLFVATDCRFPAVPVSCMFDL